MEEVHSQNNATCTLFLFDVLEELVANNIVSARYVSHGFSLHINLFTSMELQ